MSRPAYRTEMEIISDILKVLIERGMEGEYITNIVRNANLSYNIALAKCQKLINAGLVIISKEERSRNIFVMTEKGIKFYRELMGFEELVHNVRVRSTC